MTGLRLPGSKAVGSIYDTQDVANDLYLRMRVGVFCSAMGERVIHICVEHIHR